MDSQENNIPLLVLGLDLGDTDLLLRWISEGRLPFLGSLVNKGCYGRLQGPDMVCEHGIWVSIFTGKSRTEHGYYYFRQLVPGTYDLRPYDASMVIADPFWSDLLGSGKKVLIVDAPDSRPIPGLDGIQVCDWTTHYPLLPASSEPRSVLEQWGKGEIINEKFQSRTGGDRTILRRLLERIVRKGGLCRNAVDTVRPDLAVIVFSETHTASHQFWKYAKEKTKTRESAGDHEDLAIAMRNVYEAVDREMEKIAERFPEGNIVVVSSTGIEDRFPTGELLHTFCRSLDFQIDAPGSRGRSTPMGLVRSLMPETLRAGMSRMLPRTVQERWISQKFANRTLWERTTAFVIPSYYTGFVRVNLKEREPQGIVASGPEYERVLERLETDLMRLEHPVTSRPAVRSFLRCVDLFGGGPPTVLPDAFVVFESGDQWTECLKIDGRTIMQKKPDFFRGSDHTREGFFAAAGPSIRRRGSLGQMSILGMAPLFRSLMSGFLSKPNASEDSRDPAERGSDPISVLVRKSRPTTGKP